MFPPNTIFSGAICRIRHIKRTLLCKRKLSVLLSAVSFRLYIFDDYHEVLEFCVRTTMQGCWSEPRNDNTRSMFCPQINVCVFLKHMVYAVSVWQKHLCLKYSLTVPCHLAKQCGLFRTNLL